MFYFKKALKRRLIKIVSLNEVFPNLTKANFVASETILLSISIDET
jgi:hypothetical protein